MNEHSLLAYYLRELTALKKLGRTFGKEHPEIAEHLQFELGFGRNPQLAQLIEGLAFLNARVLQQFDADEFEQVNTLANVLYPHVMQTFPATAIIQWQATGSLEKKLRIPRDTLIETDTRQDINCRFSTVYDVELYPLKFIQANLINDLNFAPTLPNIAARSVLHLRLQTLKPGLKLAQLDLKQLSIYFDGAHSVPYHLYELFTQKCIKVAFKEDVKNAATFWHDNVIIQNIGFENHEYLLPTDARTADAYRILSEYFTLPQKFLFVRLTKFPEFHQETEAIDIYFYFKKTIDEGLIKQVTHDQFQLGCSPIINLFPKILEPLEINNQQTEYRAQTDLRHPENFEINQIKKIYTHQGQHKLKYYQPLFYPNKESADYWQGKFVDCQQLSDCDYPGTELFLSFTGQESLKEPESLVIEALCTNRHLPKLLANKMPLASLQPVHGNLPPLSINWCSNLNIPSPSLFSRHKPYVVFRHLLANLSHYTNNNAQQLKQLLLLYLLPQTQVNRRFIESIKNLTASPCAKFMKFANHYGYHQGVDLQLEIQGEYGGDDNSCLFFTVLQHFFASHSAMNNFLKFRINLLDKELYQWPIAYGKNSIL